MVGLSNVPGHWTDEQLIASLYDVGSDDSHLMECVQCRERLAALQANRQALERASADAADAFDPVLLAAQRRKIYARLSEPAFFPFNVRVRSWASAAATLFVLGSGFFLFEQHRQGLPENSLSDAQLAQEVSSLSQNLEAQPVAPLQGLFE